MNHCDCGANLDGDYVPSDVGASFWTSSPVEYRNLKLFLLPIHVPIPVELSDMLGEGDYLDFDNTATF